MERRDFFKLVTSSAAVVAISPSLITTRLQAHDGRLYESYEKVQLLDKDGNPLKASNIVNEENYIFNDATIAFAAALPSAAAVTAKSAPLTASPPQ